MKPIDASRIVPAMGQNDPCVPSRFGTHPGAPGWVTNGHWLVFVGEARVRGSKPWKRDMPALLELLRKQTTRALSAKEDRALRIAARPLDVGQRVYRSGRIRVVAADLYAAFLDGLDVRLADPSSTSPLLGLDDDGNLVAVVMPMHWDGPVRAPERELS